jgi:hypothetical protein
LIAVGSHELSIAQPREYHEATTGAL